MAESWKSVVSICKYGVRCLEKKTNILGDTRAGLHLNKHYDMLLQFMTYRNFITARCIIVFKVSRYCSVFISNMVPTFDQWIEV